MHRIPACICIYPGNTISWPNVVSSSAIIIDGGTALKQHWVDISCLLSSSCNIKCASHSSVVHVSPITITKMTVPSSSSAIRLWFHLSGVARQLSAKHTTRLGMRRVTRRQTPHTNATSNTPAHATCVSHAAVNTAQTKVVHFRNSRNPVTSFKFSYGDMDLEIVKNYNYFGVKFDENLNFRDCMLLLELLEV